MTRAYMFGERDNDAQRKQRESEQVGLRRQRTEELLKKKRTSTQHSSAIRDFIEYRSRLSADSLEEIHKAAFECRSKLSDESNPPIEEVIQAKLIPRFVELLKPATYEYFIQEAQHLGTGEGVLHLVNKTRVEAAWVITNVASGSTEQTLEVVNAGAVPPLIAMLNEQDDSIVDQSIWALGNIAGDNERMRDLLLSLGVLPLVIQLIGKYKDSQAHVKILRNLVWLLSNLCRGRNPSPPITTLKAAFDVVRILIHINDADIVADCIWCLSYIVDVSSDLTLEILKSDIIVRCHALLVAFANALRAKPGFSSRAAPAEPVDPVLSQIGAHSICPIIRMLGNITTGSDEVTETVVSMRFTELFRDIFYLFEDKKLPRVRKEMCWLLSNVAAGTESQRTHIINSNLLPMLIDALSRYELYIRKEALYAVINLLYFCAKNPTAHLQLPKFMNAHVIQALQNYLSAVSNSPELQAQVLDAARYALEAGSKLHSEVGENPVATEMLNTKFVDDIEDLQMSKDATVVQKAYNIIMDFFDGVEE